jgi:hypothetical protein
MPYRRSYVVGPLAAASNELIAACELRGQSSEGTGASREPARTQRSARRSPYAPVSAPMSR